MNPPPKSPYTCFVLTLFEGLRWGVFMVSKKHNPSFDLLRGSCLLGLVQLLARVMANTCQGVKKQGLQQKLRSTLN